MLKEKKSRNWIIIYLRFSLAHNTLLMCVSFWRTTPFYWCDKPSLMFAKLETKNIRNVYSFGTFFAYHRAHIKPLLVAHALCKCSHILYQKRSEHICIQYYWCACRLNVPVLSLSSCRQHAKCMLCASGWCALPESAWVGCLCGKVIKWRRMVLL